MLARQNLLQLPKSVKPWLNWAKYVHLEACVCTVQGSYLTLGMARTPEQWIWAGSLLGGGAALAGAYWLYTLSTDANKRKQYKKAFDEVSKYQ